MKNYIYSISLIVAAMISMTSCQKESYDDTEVSVKISAEIADPVLKAAGDAAEIDILHYEIWNETFTAVIADGTETVSQLTASIDLKLIRNKTYNIILWAQNSGCNAYSWDNLKEIKVSYKDAGLEYASGNEERRDAFYAVSQIKTHNVMDKYISLQRPFSQLNFFGDDLEGAVLTGSEVKVKGLSDVFDTVAGEGKVSDNAVHTFAASDVFSEVKVMNKGVEYTHAVMNYVLLPGKTDTYIDINATFGATKAGAVLTGTHEMKSVKVRKNERINIYGSLLTN